MKVVTVLLCIFVLFLSVVTANGQNGIITSGGDLTGNGGSISFTVGQVAFTTQSGVNGSVAAGVQQAYEISVITEAEDTKDLLLSCSVYPNPTTSFLFLQINTLKYNDLVYQLYDANGKLLETREVKAEKTTISMSEYVSAIYFLKVITRRENVKTFKIIKH
ncbi:T9SS type A sorting domain-containing protein [Mariniphaga sp.]|uniref:T9SS type A sorting domain-containing protein n=1 Tax=Mariniphaga sp. TaxID=1954475 RepID=UPI0035653C5D